MSGEVDGCDCGGVGVSGEVGRCECGEVGGWDCVGVVGVSVEGWVSGGVGMWM